MGTVSARWKCSVRAIEQILPGRQRPESREYFYGIPRPGLSIVSDDCFGRLLRMET